MSATVLIADDSQTIRQIVQMALKASPYSLVEASSGREVMEALKQLNARRSSPQPRAVEPARPADGAPKPPERVEEPPPPPVEKVL